MVRAVIFDLNGVFIVSRRLSDRFNEDFGVPKDQFMNALNEVMAKVRLPNAGDAYEHWKPYLIEWKVNLGLGEFYDYWFNAESINTELIEVAKDFNIEMKAIQTSFDVRLDSQKGEINFATKLLASMRNAFGGHKINNEK